MDNESVIENIIYKLIAEQTGKEISAENQEYFRLQKEYERRFGKQLVLLAVGHAGKSHVEVLKECLRTGRPYEYPDAPEDCKI